MSDLCIIPARALKDPNLTGSDIRVLCAIGIHTDGRTGEGCYAKAATLADEAGVSGNQFWTSAKRLIDGGYLIRDSGQAEGSASSYTIVLDRPRKGTPKTGVAVNPAQPEPGREHPAGEGAPTINAPFNASSSSDWSFHPDYRELLERVLNAGGSIQAWVAEIHATLDGMHGPALSKDEIGQSIRDFNASGGEISLRLFRGFLRGNGSNGSGNGSSAKPGGKGTGSKAPWLIRKEQDDQDHVWNRDPATKPRVDAAVEERGPDWWDRMKREARAADRFVYPYALQQLLKEQS